MKFNSIHVNAVHIAIRIALNIQNVHFHQHMSFKQIAACICGLTENEGPTHLYALYSYKKSRCRKDDRAMCPIYECLKIVCKRKIKSEQKFVRCMYSTNVENMH